MENERIIEFFLILILIVLIFIMVLMGLNTNHSETTISNSYNNYNTQTTTGKTAQVIKETPKRDSEFRNYDERSLEEYSSWGRHLKTEFSNYYTDEFEVHVVNNDFQGKYYTVRFYFNDEYGCEKNYEMRKYVFSDEEKEFYFRDINRNRHAYNDWKYEVVEE
jgi:hypothetical protein